MGALNPAYLGHFRVDARNPLVNRASPGSLFASPLFIRVPEAITRKRPIHAGFGAPQKPLALWEKIWGESKKDKKSAGEKSNPI